VTVPPWGSHMGSSSSAVAVNNETALRHSAVWACLRLRANLISTMPVDAFRRVSGVQIEVTKPPVLVNPGGERVGIMEWLYSTQFDLDRAGNTFGLITERDSLNNPSRIDLVPVGEVTVKAKGSEVTGYRISGTPYTPDQVWHEKQYTVAGLPVGLSPVAYAAWTIGEYLTIQDFALEWFGNSTVPVAHLKNTTQELTPDQADAMSSRFAAKIRAGMPLVSGSDWEYTPLTAANHQTDWIEGKQYGITDVARFFDCPGDLIDAAVQSGNVTYANVTQRNLQFLVMSLNPAIVRREGALSKLVQDPVFVKLNADALLRMDPQGRAAVFQTAITSRWLAPSEVRALEDRKPFTESQLAEFDRLFGDANPKPAAPPTAAPIGS
jgi:HK97 family phage portal protein